MTIESFSFGRLGGVSVPGFVLRNRLGVALKLVALGARIIELQLPDAGGRLADVVLGFDTLEQYLASDAYMGATCGRYGSRIRGGTFRLDGQAVRLNCNEGQHHAHGGMEGFDRRLWQARSDATANEVVFTLNSPDGDQGYPGTVDARVSYRLSEDNVITITMQARTDRATIVNLLHHSYWNLAGHDSGDALAQRLQLNADSYTPIDEDLIPTGAIRPVAGTPFDFRLAKPVGQDLGRVVNAGGGYDHNWCLNGAAGQMRLCATLEDPGSGRALELFTTAPGLQFYSGGHFRQPVLGKGGVRYGQYAGLALETQGFPDAPNLAHFPSPWLAPGQVYQHRMQLRLRPAA